MNAKFGYLALIIFATIALFTGCESPRQQSNERRLDIKTKLEQAQMRNQDSLARFEGELVKLETNHQSRFIAAAHDASEKAAEKQTILTTIYFLTKDKLNGGIETEAYLEQIIGPILKPVAESYSYEIDKLGSNLDRDLRNITIDFATEVSSPAGVRVMDAKKSTPSWDEWRDFDHALGQLGYRAPYVGARVLININSAVGSTPTTVLIGPIKTMAARIFSRSVVRLATTTSAAIFEGPLPIGKIVAAASFLWTGYELAQLQPNYQGEVLASTKTSFGAITSQINKGARASAAERVALFDKLLLDIRTQTHQ